MRLLLLFVRKGLAGRMPYEFQIALWTTAGVIVIVATCYAGSRAIAVAWFRTKLEYLRSVMKEGVKPNGH